VIRIYDVAVIGSGPSGAVSALEARRHGLGVCVVGPSAKRMPSGVAESLMPGAVRDLEALGIGVDGTISAGIEASWGSPSLIFQSAISNPHGPAVHVDRGLLDASLSDAIVDRGVAILASKLHGARREGDLWRLAVEGGSTAMARIVLDASGRSAVFARSVGARRLEFDTMACTVAVFESLGTACPTSLLVEAGTDGWWFCTPLGDRAATATFVTEARASIPLSAAAFAAAVARTTHISQRLEGYRIAALYRRPAGSALLAPSAGYGWVAVGDAAALVDPLSGAGIRDGLRTACAGARVCAAALSGDTEAFSKYAQSSRRAFRSYAAARAAQYNLEGRWLRRPFWARRRIDPFSLPALAGHAKVGSVTT
jgi:flavin-dependent dehydrogenase